MTFVRCRHPLHIAAQNESGGASYMVDLLLDSDRSPSGIRQAVFVLDGLCRTPLHWTVTNRGPSAFLIMLSLLKIDRSVSPVHRDFAGQVLKIVYMPPALSFLEAHVVCD